MAIWIHLVDKNPLKLVIFHSFKLVYPMILEYLGNAALKMKPML